MGIVSIIGKTLLLCASIVMHQSYAQGSVDISVRDMYGRQLTKVVVGQPFALHILMNNIDGNNARVSIEKSHAMPMQRTSVQMRSINGRASTTHIYTVRIDDRGQYTIGPVFVDDGQMRYESNQLHIEATDAPHDAHNRRGEQVMLQLIPSKPRAYAGESVSFSLRFYYPHNGIRAERLIQPPVQHATQSPIEGPFGGSQTVDNVVYDYSEWRWDMRFESPGVCAIPSYDMEYTDRSQSSTRFGLFSSFFNDFGGTKHVVSPAIQYQVMPVPSHAQASGFVGSVHHFSASLDHSKTSTGQAVVLTLELVSARHSAQLKQPLMHDVPRALKYYESKVDTTSTDTTTTTRFEYVVQPLQAGDWEISSQTYTYFDVPTGNYKTVQTDPIYLEVTQGASVVPHVDNDEKAQEIIKTQPLDAQDDHIALHEMGPWLRESNSYVIPWIWFWIIMSAPLWYVSVAYSTTSCKRYRDKSSKERRARHAYAIACKSIKHIRRTGAVEEIPQVFRQFCADKWRISLHEVTETYMHKKFSALHMSSALCEEWSRFWTRITSYVFAQKTDTGAVISDVCNDVEQWLDRLNVLL